MLKLWVLVAASATLRLISAAPASSTSQTPDDRRSPGHGRLPPLYVCLTPLSDRLPALSDRLYPLSDRQPPLSNRLYPLSDRLPPLSGRLYPLSGRASRLDWPWSDGVPEPVVGSEQQQPALSEPGRQSSDRLVPTVYRGKREVSGEHYVPCENLAKCMPLPNSYASARNYPVHPMPRYPQKCN